MFWTRKTVEQTPFVKNGENVCTEQVSGAKRLYSEPGSGQIDQLHVASAYYNPVASMSRENREKRSAALLQSYPDRVPVVLIAEKSLGLTKTKMVVPRDLQAGHLLGTIRENTRQLSPFHGLFMSINNRMVQPDTIISELYSNSSNTDGFLYVHISTESVFGSQINMDVA